MHDSVRQAFSAFTVAFEGKLLTMYLDVLGLVTTGIGCLIDPVSEAVKLPWRHLDGRPATSSEISTAWHALKARPDLAHRNAKYAAALTALALTDADVDALVVQKLESNAQYVTQHWFPYFEQFPADAQLGIMSMAWAIGPGYPAKFPTFKAAVLAGNWLGARDACDIRVGTQGQPDYNPGVAPRNRANRVCFANAEIVTRCDMARDILRWPNIAQADVPAWERPANLGTLVGIARDDARIYADEAAKRAEERMFDSSGDMSGDGETGEGGGNVA